MTMQAPTLAPIAPRTTTRRHLMSLTAGPGRPVAAALATATAHARDAARTAAKAACEAAEAALDAANTTPDDDVPAVLVSPHAAAIRTVRSPLVSARVALAVGCRPDALAAYRNEHETAVALAKRWARLTAELIGWDIAALHPGRVFVRCAALAGCEAEGRTWAALEATALAMGAALAVLDADATPDALARAQRNGADAVALAGAVTGL